MATTVNLSEDIQRIIEMTKGRTVDKKLACIQQHMRINHGINWALNDPETLELKLRENDIDPELIAEIYELLDQSFVQGSPYFIYQFTLLNNKDEQFLKQEIERILELNKEVAPLQNNFTYIKRVTDVEHRHGDFISFSLFYEHFDTALKPGEGKVKGVSIEKTTFEVFFDFKAHYCYFKCGDRKHMTFTQKYLSQSIRNLSLISFTLSSKSKAVTFEGDIQFNKQTAIIFDLLEAQMDKGNFIITDYLGITFGNAKSDKVKAVKLGGNNLFESYEVAERMRFQDRIKSIKFQLVKQFTTGGNTSAVTSDVRIDFPSTLKIVFSKMSNNAYQRDYIHHILSQLNISLTKTHKASEIDERIKDLVRIAEAKDSFLVQRILSGLKQEVKDQLTDTKEKNIVLTIIDNFMRR